MTNVFVFVLLTALLSAFEILSVIQENRKDDLCQTPNGEQATCVQLRSCPILKEAYDSGESSLNAFIDASTCGSGKFTVCCGSSANFTQTRHAPLLANVTEQDEQTLKQLKREYALHNLLPSKTYCGRQHWDDYLHLENETKVSVDEFPWLVDFKYVGSEPYDSHLHGQIPCSGVLISNRYVLTLRFSSFRRHIDDLEVVLGQHRYRRNSSCTPTSVGVKDCSNSVSIKIEKDFKFPGSYLALIRLAETVFFSDYVRPICLPMQQPEYLKIGDIVTATGWSIYEQRKHDQETNTFRKDKRYEQVLNNTDCEHISQRAKNRLCTISEKRHIVYCWCDVGAPKMYQYRTNWFVQGITLKLNCDRGKPSLSEKITLEVVNWILENMEE